MPPILATIDVEDVGSSKVRELRDALTDLLHTQQAVSQSSTAMAGGMATGVTALGSVAGATRTAADGLASVAAAAQTFNAAVSSFSSYGRAYADTLGAGARVTQEFATTLTVLSSAAQGLAGVTEADRKALADLTGQMKVGAEVTASQSAEITRLSTVLQGVQGPLAGVTTGSVAAAGGLTQLGGAAAGLAPAASGGTAAIINLVEHIHAIQVQAQAGVEQIRVLGGGLAALAGAAQSGGVPLGVMAQAAAALAKAAAEGVPGLSQNAAALQAMTEQLEAGIPLTQEQAKALEEMALELADAHREALGMGTALQQMAAAERAANQIIVETFNSLKLLSAQLKEGVTVTRLQAAAMQELAQRAKEGNGFTAEQAAQLRTLADAMKTGAVVTREQADALRVLTAQYAEAHKEVLGFKEANEEQLSSFERFKLGALAVAAVLVELGHAALSYSTEAAQSAARTDVLNTVMLVTSKNARLSSVEMQTQVERIKALGITTQEATDTVIKFVQAQLKVTDAAKLARVAQDLAVVAGINSSEAFERLTQAIQSQQAVMLHSFGIVTGLQAIYGDYAAEVGKTVKQLDEADKKQAFLNKILQEGTKFAGAYEAAMGQVGKQYTSLARLQQEVMNSIGQGLIPLFEVYVKTVTFLTESFLKLDPAAKAAASAILAIGGAMATVGGILGGAKLLGILELLEGIPGKVKLATVAFTELGAAGGILSGIWAALVAFFGGPVTAGIVAFAAAVSVLTGAFVLLNGKSETSVDSLRTAVAEARKGVDPINELAKAVDTARIAMEKSAKIKDPIGSAIHQSQVDSYNKLLDSLTKKLEAAGVGFVATGASADQVTAALKRLNEEGEREQAVLVNQIKGALDDATAAYNTQKEALEALRTELRIVIDAHGDVEAALTAARAALDKNENAISGQTSVWRDLWTLLKNEVIIVWRDLVGWLTTAWNWIVKVASIVGGDMLVALRLWGDTLGGYVGKAIEKVVGWLEKLGATFTNFRAILHREAQESTVEVAAGGGQAAQDALTGQIAIQQKSITLAKEHKSQLERLLNETDPARKATYNAEQLKAAQQEAFLKLGLVDPSSPEYRKRLSEIKAGAGELFNEIVSGQKKVKDGATGKTTLVNIDASELTKITTEIREKLEGVSKAAEKEGEKYKKALEQFLGVDPEQNRRLQALNAALAQTKGNHDAYLAVIQRGSKDIEKFNMLTDAQKAKLGGLSEVAAASALQIQKAADAISEHWAKANREAALAFSEATRQDSVKQSDELARLQIANANKLRDESLKANDAIRKDQLALQDDLAAQYLRGTDLLIYQTKRKVDEIRKAGEDEKRQRQLQIDDERRSTEERIRLNHQELADFANVLIKKRELEVASLRDRLDEVRKNGSAIAIAEAESQLAGAEKGLASLREQTLVRQAEADKQLMIVDAALRKEVDVHQTAVNQMNGARDKMTDQQVAALARMVKESTSEWGRYKEFALSALDGIVNAAMNGFQKMLEGAGNWKDALIGIWQSVKASLFELMTGMVKQWISSLVAMKTASGQSDLVSGLTGGAGGVGGGGGGNLTSQISNMVMKRLFGGGSGAATTIGAGGIPNVNVTGGLSGSVGTPIPTPGQPVGGGMASGMSTMQAGIVVGLASYAGAGLADKIFKKWIDGSSLKGTAVGAAAGAAAGAGTGAAIGAMGGPIGAGTGALIGLGVGALKGWWDARKAREEMRTAREEIIEEMGGIEKLQAQAREAGVDIQKFLNTDSPKKFQEELVKIQKAFEALDLRKVKEQLPQVFSQFTDLRRQAQLVGFDINRLYNAQSVEEYNTAQEDLNKTLAAQQVRLGGLATAAQGLAQRMQVEASVISKAFKDIFPKDEDLTEFLKKFKEARDKGFTGTASDFGKGNDSLDLTAEQLSKIDKLVNATQESMNRFGGVTTSVFAGVLAETGDIFKAFEAVGPSLDVLEGMIESLGVTASSAGLTNLLQLREIVNQNPEVVAALQGITAMVRGLADANRLTQESFNALGQDAVKQFENLILAGSGENNALILMQPTLQALYDAQKSFNFAVDEGTQALINQGVSAGLVGDQFQSVQQKTLDILVLIAETLGADIPAAYGAVRDAAVATADVQQQRQRDTTDAIQTGEQAIKRQAEAHQRVRDAATEAGGTATQQAGVAVTAAERAAQAIAAQRQEWEKNRAEIDRNGGAVTTHGGVVSDTLGGPAAQAIDKYRSEWVKSGGVIRDQNGAVLDFSGKSAAEIEKMLADLGRYREGWAKTSGAVDDTGGAVTRHGGVVGGVIGGAAASAIERYRGEWTKTGSVIKDSEGVVNRYADGAGSAMDRLRGRIRTVRDEFNDATAAAETFGKVAEDGATGAAEGHSPTGMKQLVHRIREASQLYREFSGSFVSQSRDIETAAGRTGLGVNGVAASGGNVSVNLTVANSYAVNGTKATSREQWEELRGEVTRDLDNNTNQIASKIATAAGRYMKR